MIVSYDDDVTAEHVRAIEEMVSMEFATGDWVVVEKEPRTLDPNPHPA